MKLILPCFILLAALALSLNGEDKKQTNISLGEFGATSFLARSDTAFTAPLAIFRLLSQPGDLLRGRALALSVILGILVAMVAALAEWRRDDTTVTL